MSVLAISETLGSLGNDIGRRVAEALGWEFANREIIAKAAERFGEGVMDLTHVTEERPTLWERFTDTQRRYVTYVKAVVLEMAARDRIVLSGRAATILLDGIAHVLKVRITAPESVRAERVQREQSLAPEAALDWVRHHDRERAARVRFLYHVDWDDPMLYDLYLNTERVTVDRGVRLLLELLAAPEYQPTEASRQALVDRSLAAQAAAELLHRLDARIAQLDVTCTDGRVRLTGFVRDEDEWRRAQEVVAAIPGVRGVDNEIVALPVPRGAMAGL